MDSPFPKDCFLESLKRCSSRNEFMQSFYVEFLASSEIVRQKFSHVDMKHQSRMLLGSLHIIASAVAGIPEGLRELKARAESHDRQHLNITPELYDCWRNAMLVTARQFDEQWSESVEEAWNRILGFLTTHMIRSY